MPSKKGQGGAKGKGPAPKGKGKQAPKRPMPQPSSSSEDELDTDQLAVLGQLAAMERAQGVSPRPGVGVRRDPTRPWFFAGEVLDRLAFLNPQTPSRSPITASGLVQPPSQLPQPVLQRTVVQESRGAMGTSAPTSGAGTTGILGSAAESGSQVVAPVVSAGMAVASGSMGATQVS